MPLEVSQICRTQSIYQNFSKKPKCKRTVAKKADKDKKEKERVEESETAPIEDVFRRMRVLQPECPNENWDYADAIQCTDGYRNGSTCQIQGTGV